MNALRALAGLAACVSTATYAQQGDGTNVEVVAHVTKPALVEATPARQSALKVADGYAVNVFAQNLKNARMIAVAEDGGIYVTRREQGDVVRLTDKDGDGKADGPATVVLNRPETHGIAIHEEMLYVATGKEIFVGAIKGDGEIDDLKMLMGDLPDTGQHPNRTIAFGPDGMLYISVGSTCNACNEGNPEIATILRASPDGKSRVIVATGLRNTIGFDWNPSTGQLWGMDHGIDFLGDEQQPEELNLIEAGHRYGWPHIWGAGEENPQSSPPGGITKAEWKALSTPMTLGYTAHAAPMQMLFYTGSAFPADARGDAFVAMRGSWNRSKPSGYEIVRIRFKDGTPQAFEPFMTGFLTDGGKTHFARPVGLAMTKDGALLMADDANGVIYRVSHKGTAGLNDIAAATPAEEMKQQATKGGGVPLALARTETQTKGPVLRVTSDSFVADGAIPLKHSEYADGLSPQLTWSAIKGAKSYAIIMEDPDAKPITPFVHWVAWNIPSNVTSLPMGLQEQEKLTLPPEMLQGRTSRGSVAYFGPRPPVGDPDHHYHFQIFALDRVLDIPPGSDRDTLLAAAKGHVLAKGELVGTYAQTIAPLK